MFHVTAVHPAAQLYAAALRLDGPTLANLELLENSTGESAGSLLWRLDSCACAGGALGLPTPVSRAMNVQAVRMDGSAQLTYEQAWGDCPCPEHPVRRLTAAVLCSCRRTAAAAAVAVPAAHRRARHRRPCGRSGRAR